MSPLISLVIPCYNVAEYLPDFLRSLDRSLADDVEAVFVIDGATDATATVIRGWAGSVGHRVRVIEQENRGLSGARNTGLEAALGEWVSFPDPDDILDRGYIDHVRDTLRDAPPETPSLVATNIVLFDGATGAITNDHPLRWKFADGARTVRLEKEPDYVQLSSATAFLRRARLVELGLRFDPAVRPSFEDSALIARYLLSFDDPTVSLVPAARYLYRRRADATSLVQSSWSNPAKYDDQLRHGYLGLLELAAQRGRVPVWVQQTVLYDITWYLTLDLKVHAETAALTPAQVNVFQDLLAKIVRHLDAEVIAGYRVTHLPVEARTSLLAARRSLPAHPTVHVRSYDADQHLTQVTFFTDVDGLSASDVGFAVAGVPVRPAYAKRRSIVLMGAAMATEITAWLPGSGPVTAIIGDALLTVVRGAPTGPGPARSPHPTRLHAVKDAAQTVATFARHDRARLVHVAALAAARTVRTRVASTPLDRALRLGTRFKDCWLFIDRDTEAHDNAEHLYRYVRDNHPEINAWFVLSRTSADWDRLAADRFRLIEHNSLAHVLALAQCRELISSQIDHYIVHPPAAIWTKNPQWRFTWLQHGVTHNDLSRWVNPKPVTTVIAATHDEAKAFADDDTPYVWTDREVKLTGFPRHDELLRKAAAVAPGDRRSIVFMPTWRRYLLGDSATVGGNRRPARDAFWESEYVTNWFGLLSSPSLHAAAQAANLELILMPHPNMTPVLAADRVPRGVTLRTYEDSDIQDVIAHAAHVVTDYSSNAFDAALADRPVLYFQFDREALFGGAHAYRRGYFDYDADGFGPVALTLPEAETAISAAITAGTTPVEPYRTRIERTFALRDGGACARVVAAIKEHRKVWTAPTSVS